VSEKIWIVGNSQLHQAILAEYCSKEDYLQFAEDWKNQRVSSGKFSANNRHFNFLFCNMTMLGDISFDGSNVFHTAQMMDFVKRINEDASTIIVMLRGNEFAFESLVETTIPWDFSSDGNPASKGRQLLKKSDVLNHLEKVTNPLLATCILYRMSFPKATIHHVVAPPPIESESHILENPEGFGPLFFKFGLRPFEIRKKIYSAMYDTLSNNLLRYGVNTWQAPTESLTESGGLRSDFASGCLHGNHNYGRAILKQLEERKVYAPV
jgi:hypothetical protein